MNDDTLTSLVARGLVDEVIHLFNEHLSSQLKIRQGKKRIIKKCKILLKFALMWLALIA